MKNAPQLALALLFVALALAACQAIPAMPAGDSASLADEIAARGSVRIGVRNDNPPLSFVTEDGDWVGFDVDLAHAMAEQLGLEPELIVVDGTTRISFLQEGRVDISIASMNHTPQTRQRHRLQHHLLLGQSVLSHPYRRIHIHR